MPDIYVDESGNKDITIEEKNPSIPETSVNKPIEIAKKELNLESKKEKRHNHVIAAYCEHPNEINYVNFLENEKALLFLRQHFTTNLDWIIIAIILAVSPIILGALISLFNMTLFGFLPYSYIFLGLIFYYLVIFGYIFVSYITWFYNISLITTSRIIDIDFSHIVFENVSASNLGKIEDVHYKQVGIMASLFDYGDITVQTAGTKIIGFDFHAVPHPEKIIHFINSLIGSGELKNG